MIARRSGGRLTATGGSRIVVDDPHIAPGRKRRPREGGPRLFQRPFDTPRKKNDDAIVVVISAAERDHRALPRPGVQASVPAAERGPSTASVSRTAESTLAPPASLGPRAGARPYSEPKVAGGRRVCGQYQQRRRPRGGSCSTPTGKSMTTCRRSARGAPGI